MKIVELLVIENNVISLIKNEAIYSNIEIIEMNHFKDKEELRLFLVDDFQLSNTDGIPDSDGMFSSKDNLSFYYNKDGLCGTFRVFNNKPYEEIIEGKFKFIKALKDTDNNYYELNKLNLENLII